MGVGSAKKAAAKSGASPMVTRRSASKIIKDEFPNTPSPTPRSVSARKKVTATPLSHSHHLPSAEKRRNNGRVSGRSLIVWGRPRMAEKLLLHLQYECARHKVAIPMDAIAHRLHPGSSGAAVMQHLNRLRKELIAEGHLVPPLPCRPGMGETSDPEIRGYVRKDEEGEDKETTRPVRFDEPMDDRKFSIPSVFNLEDAENQGADLFTPERSFAEDVFSPHSPTPGPRAYRPMSATRRGYQLPPRPAPMELLENEDFRHAPLDADHLENGGNPVEEDAEHDVDMASAEARRPDNCYGDHMQGARAPPAYGMYQSMGNLRHPMDHHGPGYGDHFHGRMAHPHPYHENGQSFPKSAYEQHPYYHASSYGPWGHHMPDPRFGPPGYPMQRSDYGGPVASSGYPAAQPVDRATDIKMELSRAETLSSSETQSSEAHPSESQLSETQLSDAQIDELIVGASVLSAIPKLTMDQVDNPENIDPSELQRDTEF